MITTVRDITEGMTHIEQLRRLADHDALTQLLGRRRFQEEVERRIRERSRFGDTATLLLVDLDDFKSINDTHGHLIGDQALLAVADALRGAIRETDVIGRLGGDEFGVLLLQTIDGGDRRVLRNIERSLAAITIETSDAPTRPVVVGAAHHPRPSASTSRAAPSFTRPLRQTGRGARSSSHGHTAPRGAEIHLPNAVPAGRQLNERLPPRAGQVAALTHVVDREHEAFLAQYPQHVASATVTPCSWRASRAILRCPHIGY